MEREWKERIGWNGGEKVMDAEEGANHPKWILHRISQGNNNKSLAVFPASQRRRRMVHWADSEK